MVPYDIDHNLKAIRICFLMGESHTMGVSVRFFESVANRIWRMKGKRRAGSGTE